MISRRPFLLLRISFPGRPIFIQFVPGEVVLPDEDVGVAQRRQVRQPGLEGDRDLIGVGQRTFNSWILIVDFGSWI